MTRIGTPFAKQSTKKLKATNGGGGVLYDCYKGFSKAAGVKKPNESQKSEGILARDSGEYFYDPERKDSILGRDKTRQASWEEMTSARRRQCSRLSAACGGQHDWRNPNGVLVIQDSTDLREVKVLRAHEAG